MARPGRTIDAAVMVGTGTWFVNLSEDVTSLDVSGSTNITRQPGLGRRYEASTFHSGTHTINIGNIYVGDKTEALRAQQGTDVDPWVCVADPKAGLMYAMTGLLTGLPENAPTSGEIATSIAFPQADRMIASGVSGAATSFSLVDSGESASIGNIAIGDSVILVVTEIENSGAAIEVTVTGRPDQSVTAPGIWDLGKASGASNSATVSVPAADLTGSEKVSGYVLIGKEVGADG